MKPIQFVIRLVNHPDHLLTVGTKGDSNYLHTFPSICKKATVFDADEATRRVEEINGMGHEQSRVEAVGIETKINDRFYLRNSDEVVEFIRDHDKNEDLAFVYFTGKDRAGKFGPCSRGLIMSVLKVNLVPHRQQVYE